MAARSCFLPAAEIKNRHQGRVSSKGPARGFRRERNECWVKTRGAVGPRVWPARRL